MEEFRLSERCTFVRITENMDVSKFTCGDMDLDDFFHEEATLYTSQLLGKTYAFVTNEKPYTVVAMVTLANDSIKSTLVPKSSRNRLQRKIPYSKHTRSYPAVLIGRLGVSVNYQGKSRMVGSQIISYLKYLLTREDNLTGCRFLVVDAYNDEKVISFYGRNGFSFLYPTEALEKEAFHINEEESLHSRLMYLDLLNTTSIPVRM